MQSRLWKLVYAIAFACACSTGYGHVKPNGDRYYSYIGLGAGLGGTSINPNVTTNINNVDHNINLGLHNGLAVGGVNGGMQMQGGFEWRLQNHFYAAIELNGNVFFNASQLSSSLSGTFGTSDVYSYDAHTNSGGTNSFMGVYASTRLGWTDSADAIAAYFIVGAGYEFISGQIDATRVSIIENMTDVFENHINFGGGRLQYGIGASYYFNDNFGIYFHFVMTSPIPQGSFTNTTESHTPINPLNPSVEGKDFNVELQSLMSYSYFLNLGLVVRF